MSTQLLRDIKHILERIDARLERQEKNSEIKRTISEVPTMPLREVLPNSNKETKNEANY